MWKDEEAAGVHSTIFCTRPSWQDAQLTTSGITARPGCATPA
jgi:hypothetical protein